MWTWARASNRSSLLKQMTNPGESACCFAFQCREISSASRASALYSAGLRPSLHPVFGSTFFREASSKEGFLPFFRPTPCIHQSGASCPAPSRASLGAAEGCANPRTSAGFLVALQNNQSWCQSHPMLACLYKKIVFKRLV